MRVFSRHLLIFSFFCLFGSVSLHAKDKIQTAFERLAIHDYFNARDLFLRSAEKKPAPAWYGLSKISLRNNNPFFNLDSARLYILRSDSAYRLLDVGEKEATLKKYAIDYLSIESQKDSVAGAAFTLAQQMNNLETWNKFIGDYTYSGLVTSAVTQRNKLAFLSARNVNSSDAYKTFLSTYPDAVQANEAHQHYEERLFYERTGSHIPSAYAAFISTNPDSPYRSRAEDSLYVLSTSGKTVEEYYAFAKKYPGNKNASQAWMKMYHRYLDEHGADSFKKFMTDYPDFPYLNRVADDYMLYNTVLLPVRNSAKWGFITGEGKPAIATEFEEVDKFSESLCAASKGGKYGYVSKAGKTEIDFQYDDAETFENNVALVRKNGKALLINRDGEPLFAALHEDLSTPHEDIIAFLDSELFGYADLKGRTLIEAKYETAGDFRNGLAIAGKEDSLGVIDRQGRWIVPPVFSFIEMAANGLLRVIQDEKFGLYNRFGEMVLPVEYDVIGKFTDGLALVVKNGKAGYINDSAAVAIPIVYDFSNETLTQSEFYNGYAVVSLKKKSGLLDMQGNRILPAVYEDLRFTHDTLPVAVRKKGKWGYINMENKTVIEYKFDDAGAFTGPYAVARKKGLAGMIDTVGKILLPFEYDFILPLKDGIALVKKSGLTGLYGKNNSVLVPLEFETGSEVSPGILKFERNKKFGYFDIRKNEWLWKEEGL